MPASPLLLRSACVALACLCAPSVRADEVTEVRALLARGDAEGALQRAQAAAAAQPRDAQLRFLQAVALMDLKRDVDALALFTRLSQEYPELPDPQNNIALLHARAGRLEQARLALEAALRSDPSHRLARTNLGQVYLMLAVQAWDQAAMVGPLEPALQRRLEAVRALLLPAAR
jgi:Flp pilus assembly protein TadD